jgi:hypothetical protein
MEQNGIANIARILHRESVRERILRSSVRAIERHHYAKSVQEKEELIKQLMTTDRDLVAKNQLCEMPQIRNDIALFLLTEYLIGPDSKVALRRAVEADPTPESVLNIFEKDIRDEFLENQKNRTLKPEKMTSLIGRTCCGLANPKPTEDPEEALRKYKAPPLDAVIAAELFLKALKHKVVQKLASHASTKRHLRQLKLIDTEYDRMMAQPTMRPLIAFIEYYNPAVLVGKDPSTIVKQLAKRTKLHSKKYEEFIRVMTPISECIERGIHDIDTKIRAEEKALQFTLLDNIASSLSDPTLTNEVAKTKTGLQKCIEGYALEFKANKEALDKDKHSLDMDIMQLNKCFTEQDKDPDEEVFLCLGCKIDIDQVKERYTKMHPDRALEADLKSTRELIENAEKAQKRSRERGLAKFTKSAKDLADRVEAIPGNLHSEKEELEGLVTKIADAAGLIDQLDSTKSKEYKDAIPVAKKKIEKCNATESTFSEFVNTAIKHADAVNAGEDIAIDVAFANRKLSYIKIAKSIGNLLKGWRFDPWCHPGINKARTKLAGALRIAHKQRTSARQKAGEELDSFKTYANGLSITTIQALRTAEEKGKKLNSLVEVIQCLRPALAGPANEARQSIQQAKKRYEALKQERIATMDKFCADVRAKERVIPSYYKKGIFSDIIVRGMREDFDKLRDRRATIDSFAEDEALGQQVETARQAHHSLVEKAKAETKQKLDTLNNEASEAGKKVAELTAKPWLEVAKIAPVEKQVEDIYAEAKILKDGFGLEHYNPKAWFDEQQKTIQDYKKASLETATREFLLFESSAKNLEISKRSIRNSAAIVQKNKADTLLPVLGYFNPGVICRPANTEINLEDTLAGRCIIAINTLAAKTDEYDKLYTRRVDRLKKQTDALITVLQHTEQTLSAFSPDKAPDYALLKAVCSNVNSSLSENAKTREFANDDDENIQKMLNENSYYAGAIEDSVKDIAESHYSVVENRLKDIEKRIAENKKDTLQEIKKLDAAHDEIAELEERYVLLDNTGLLKKINRQPLDEAFDLDFHARTIKCGLKITVAKEEYEKLRKENTEILDGALAELETIFADYAKKEEFDLTEANVRKVAEQKDKNDIAGEMKQYVVSGIKGLCLHRTRIMENAAKYKPLLRDEGLKDHPYAKRERECMEQANTKLKNAQDSLYKETGRLVKECNSIDKETLQGVSRCRDIRLYLEASIEGESALHTCVSDKEGLAMLAIKAPTGKATGFVENLKEAEQNYAALYTKRSKLIIGLKRRFAEISCTPKSAALAEQVDMMKSLFKSQFPNAMDIYYMFKDWKKDKGLERLFATLDANIIKKRREITEYYLNIVQELANTTKNAEAKLKEVESTKFYKKNLSDLLFSRTQHQCKNEIEYCKQAHDTLFRMSNYFIARYSLPQ